MIRIGDVARKLGFQTLRRHAIRFDKSTDYIGCGFAWQKEGDGYFLELEIWLTDGYSEEEPALIGVDIPGFLLGRDGIDPYSGYQKDISRNNTWTEPAQLHLAIEQHFDPWAEKWTNCQVLIDYFLQMEGVEGAATEFPEIPLFESHKAPINSYFLTMLYGLLGDFENAKRWSIGVIDSVPKVETMLNDIRSGRMKKKPFSAVSLI